MFIDMQKYVYFENVLNVLYIEIKHKWQNGENKRYKKCPLFSFASSNSSQFYF